MNTESLWEAITARVDHYPLLNEDIEVDVAIIGGGITGVTAASHLIRAGKKVALVEAHQIGGVTTAYSTGNLYIPVQPFYQKIVSNFDIERAKLIAQSRAFAIDYIENQVREKNIDCHFKRRPWFGYTLNGERISIDKEYEILKKMDIPVEYVQDMPLKLPFQKAITIPNQARFNPLQYVMSLAADAAKQGCLIFENSRVLSYEEKDICTLKTEHGQIRAQHVFMATHVPIGVNHHTQLITAGYRSYLVAVRVQDNYYPEGHFYDLDRPPHATCTHPISGNDPELLMVAGSHHKVGQGADTFTHYDELTQFLKTHFPVSDIAYTWSSQHYQSADAVPYIGLADRFAKNTYVATGYFADGLVYGTLAALIVGDLILKRENPFAQVYDCLRFKPIVSTPFILKENANVYMQFLKDMPMKDAQNFDDIKIGEGKVVSRQGEKCAVSRDENNQLHIVSAVCTHMQGIVNWNDAEKTWDCPCHASRFTPDGEVIEGPAELPLNKL